MSKLQRFLNWSWEEKRAFALAGWYLFLSWLDVRVLKKYRKYGLALDVQGSVTHEATVELCTKSISRWMDNLPGQPSCLIQSLALKRLLQLHNIPCRIDIFVRRKEESTRLEFHSLVFVQDKLIFGNDGTWTGIRPLRFDQPQSENMHVNG